MALPIGRNREARPQRRLILPTAKGEDNSATALRSVDRQVRRVECRRRLLDFSCNTMPRPLYSPAVPLLRREGPKDAVALTKDKDRVLAYNLTPAGLRRLRDNGVRIGSSFPSSILASLIRTGDAHSPRPAEEPGQGKLFDADTTSNELPRCEATGSTADLHLVVHGIEGSATAQLLFAGRAFCPAEIDDSQCAHLAARLRALGPA